jgi:hypothetical protein
MYSSDSSGLIAHVSYAGFTLSPSNNRVQCELAWLGPFDQTIVQYIHTFFIFRVRCF